MELTLYLFSAPKDISASELQIAYLYGVFCAIDLQRLSLDEEKLILVETGICPKYQTNDHRSQDDKFGYPIAPLLRLLQNPETLNCIGEGSLKASGSCFAVSH